MLSSRFLALLLPVLAAAAPAPSVSPANTHVSPAIALENRFKAVHDAHHAEKKGLDIRILDRGDVFDAPITGVVTTRNELVNKSCAPIIVIFARGTTEPGIDIALRILYIRAFANPVTGNVGDDVGPQFFDALAALRPGRTIVQGVNNYDASVCKH